MLGAMEVHRYSPRSAWGTAPGGGQGSFLAGADEGTESGSMSRRQPEEEAEEGVPCTWPNMGKNKKVKESPGSLCQIIVFV